VRSVFAHLRLAPLALVLLLVGATQPPTTVPTHPSHPKVGFTFVSANAAWNGYQPTVALAVLLHELHPDLVRIPIYWDSVAPSSGGLDFGEVDALLATVTASNSRHRANPTQVILVAGVRNLAWPEVHLPSWVDTGTTLDLASITSSSAYLAYLEGTFRHYAANPLLYAWQVENEPLDSTNDALGDISLGGATVADEVGLLKTIDPVHRSIVTTYNSASVDLDMQKTSNFSWLYELLPGPKPAGHPMPALSLGDILGLDVYVDTPSTPLADASVTQRIGWKAASLAYWADQALQEGKELWITEMQGSTWNGEAGFSPEDLLESAQQYSGTGVSVVLLWGVEDWLIAPNWMLAGQTAFQTLRN
jgi:hypothetical protein